MDERLKKLYDSVDDTGSYGGVERLNWRAVEDQILHITRNAVRDVFIAAAGLHSSQTRKTPLSP